MAADHTGWRGRAGFPEAEMVDHPQLPYLDHGQHVDAGLSARAILTCIRRHLVVVLAPVLLFSALGAVVGLGLPSWFQAEAVLVINSRPHRISDVQEVLPDPVPDIPVIRSETDVLQSRSVIEQVVRGLSL